MQEAAAVWVHVAELKPWAANPRQNAKAIDEVAKSIRRFGWGSPIVANKRDGEIIAGHTRFAAAAKLKLDKVPVRWLDLDPADAHALALADNKVGEVATWDDAVLRQVLAELKEADESLLADTGFSDDELARLMGDDAPTVLEPEGEQPEVDEKGPVHSVPGEVYQLGPHRLMCGDSTSVDAVETLMSGKRAVLMVTDPPYGVKLDQSWRDDALGDKALGKGNRNVVANDERADWYDVWAIAPADIAYVWHASSFTDVVMDSLRRAAFEVRQQIIWNKSVMIMGRSAYHFKHEPCWYAVRKGCSANWQGDRKQTTVWDAAPPNHIMGGSKEDKTPHPTQKPRLVYEIPIANHTIAGDALYEPFGGSGTALIVCAEQKRVAYVMELDPRYCDVIRRRWTKWAKANGVEPGTGALDG